ncbi:MAG: putative toxin-antitoxin system toxin component, PIN family [Spirochaetales bacterium]|nr:putative toxin-antitoxin system toxin component, PIN family [Spirochaetales bacterium]
MIDTNVLISAFVFGGKAGALLELLFDRQYELLISDYIDAEFKEKLDEKWSDKADKVYDLYRTLPFIFCESSDIQYKSLRDEKDTPILNDALFHKVDIILSGDKDFLEAELDSPLVFSPSMLYVYLMNN